MTLSCEDPVGKVACCSSLVLALLLDVAHAVRRVCEDTVLVWKPS